MIKKYLLTTAYAGIAALSASQASALDEITVAYFLEWPMPFQFAKANGTYEEEMGVKINWVSFDTGTAMSAAMASGDVQIAVSQGVPPFVVATSAGQDLQAVDVAVSYSDNDNCVVAEALEIDKDSAGELNGKKVGVPIGTAAHYGFLSQMAHFGVDVGSMEIVDMAPADGAAAFAQGNLDMVCGWGGALRRMVEHGNVLLTGAEKEELGILVFDVTSAPAEFAESEGELLSKFLKVTADANAMWNSGDKKDEMLPVIAKDAGMDLADAEATIATFTFPSAEEQLSEKWLGGGAQTFMKGVADIFVNAGSIEAALDSYEGAVNSAPLEAAQN
ncbi:ABC transporter substrate-binding protein [Leisingera caerulea]|uniref:ABC transporter substrate-binding protein n=1 Tax=Leisingera caerulea TaxID=506591 RepID=A0A9Q9HF01_LEICA|nr:ABC transporter substrate-binding protein [Leisingera caerulea]UWQ49031.1 ABC transporter substrate-binding protein [Leisingera caerulea]UWQ53081.1 ABC transporter substrate-binding protein [Leisingera caerulea]UWQ57670.1 ABC transporter substrate-binding protein [Leisingera caerulea]UWQ61897.1 ABC transporter substrate-binding protein [Leisingera caerulea]UWQ82776.1 ABC transporter substrate-binding protein [Leisingera caerulea]